MSLGGRGLSNASFFSGVATKLGPALALEWDHSGGVGGVQGRIYSAPGSENVRERVPESRESPLPASLARMKIYGLIKTADSISNKWLMPPSK